MHNLNLFNMRVMLLVGKFLWSEQTTLSTHKTTPEANAVHSANIANGHGEQFLKTIWYNATSSASEWARLGLAVQTGADHVCLEPGLDPFTGLPSPGVIAEEIPSRLGSFLFLILEARFWAYAEGQHRWPGKFAGLLHGMDLECLRTGYGLISSPVGSDILDQARVFWDICTEVESAQNMFPGMAELRKQVYWMDWPICQLSFRLMAQCHWEPVDRILKFIRRLFVRIGDTKGIEETHKIIRATTRHVWTSTQCWTKKALSGVWPHL